VNPTRHQILVIGCGSIGERHLRTFLATGRVGAIACDNRPAIRQKMTEQYGVESMPDCRAAWKNPAITGVVVATPAPLHVEYALEALAAGKDVLIEKPLGVELAGIDRLQAARDISRRFVAVAYINHCVPVFRDARDFIVSAAFGPVRHVVVSAGQHFPTFRPAYRDIYYRDHAQGGGAIQDALTHLANLVEWIIGPTTRVYCDAAHQVLDGVEVEDTVNVVARNGGALVNYALNQFQAANEIRVDFHAEKGCVRVERHADRWGTLSRGETEWNWRSTAVASRDAIFEAQANGFLDGTEGRLTPLCTLEEGIQTLRFNLAALQSWQQGVAIEIRAGGRF
jgi:predicted dehydrogenase